MKKRNRISAIVLAVLAALTTLFASCQAKFQASYDRIPKNDAMQAVEMPNDARTEADEYGRRIVKENDFVSTDEQPVSTFSADVDTASYTFFRRLVNSGYNLEELSVTADASLRTEEMVNYFRYDCPLPDGKLFGVKAVAAPSPYNDSLLLMLTLQSEQATPAEKNNFVFLIDVSGSMDADNKLPLLKKAFRTLTDRLGDDDVVSIVTYSGKEEVVLEGCSGAKKDLILQKIDSLRASGSTNGEAGLKKAYELAEKYRIAGGNNRIFMASDGDLNVGISSEKELKDYISGKRRTGVFLSVLGFGTGNYRDANMEAIADNGNGVYLYIDGETEAEKVFGQDLFANLYTVAKDVKLQITFEKEKVARYRLIGYENRLLNPEDFEDDTKDAGDLGSGCCVTVFYELILREGVDPDDDSLPFGRLAVRAKAPNGEKSIEEDWLLDGAIRTTEPDGDFRFAAAVVECSAVVRKSSYAGNASLAHVKEVLDGLETEDPYRLEFKELISALIRAGER